MQTPLVGSICLARRSHTQLLARRQVDRVDGGPPVLCAEIARANAVGGSHLLSGLRSCLPGMKSRESMAALPCCAQGKRMQAWWVESKQRVGCGTGELH